MVPTQVRLRDYIKSLTLIVLFLTSAVAEHAINSGLAIAWHEASVINSNLHISMMCTGGVSHEKSAPPSKLGAWQPLLSI